MTITWACIRANSPGSAALFALNLGRDTSEHPAMYYLGVRRTADRRGKAFAELLIPIRLTLTAWPGIIDRPLFVLRP